MKKSIYKVTGWSLAIAAAMVFALGRNSQTIVKSSSSQGFVSSIDDNNAAQNIDAKSNNDYAISSSIDQNLSEVSGNFTPNSSATKETQNKDIAVVPSMGIIESNNLNETSTNSIEESNTQDAWAKGGPSVSDYGASQEYSTSSPLPVSPNNNVVASPSVSSTTSTATSARVSAPSVVTAPPSPGSTGGSGGGDPFVPIDDYYGLIFLVAVSTVIGVFTIKKSKIL